MRLRFVISFALAGAVAAAIAIAGEKTRNVAVPISKEHHHHLIIENSYVKAYEVELPPHESTLLHEHDFDYAYVVLGAADVTNAVEGKPEVKLHLPNGAVNFSRGPFAHIARNDGDAPFLNVTIELLQPQGDQTAHEFATMDETFDTIPALGGKTEFQTATAEILETQATKGWVVWVAPDFSWSAPHDGKSRLIVLVDKIRIKSRKREKKAPAFPPNMLVWVDANESWSFRNDERENTKVLVLEFAGNK
jgi:hypothetical protein